MKKIISICLLTLLVVFSCKKLSDLFTFEISNSETIKIPASGLVNIPIISPVPVSANSEETFENNNTKADLVKDVSLTRLTLTITDPATENFDFLKTIKIYIGTDENDKVLLASLDNVPTGVSTIELNSNHSKLDKYIKAPTYTLFTEVTLRSSIAKELSVRADSRFKVTADPL